MVYGYLRETEEEAIKTGLDKDTNLPRTGLDTYLKIIFPEIKDWIHNKTVPNLKDKNDKISKIRPDYRSETLKMIIEFDGLPHYQNPDIILKDIEKDMIYKSNGYKVVRIPYFIQLTKDSVKVLFNIDLDFELFDLSSINKNMSLGINSKATPAYLCPLGIKKMAKEYIKFPKHLQIDLEYLRKINNDNLTGLSYLEKELNKLKIIY
nr:MAG TPA: hypothetical protein [Caudoviricetes sp.]